jgi:hypothetical protein
MFKTHNNTCRQNNQFWCFNLPFSVALWEAPHRELDFCVPACSRSDDDKSMIVFLLQVVGMPFVFSGRSLSAQDNGPHRHFSTAKNGSRQGSRNIRLSNEHRIS